MSSRQILGQYRLLLFMVVASLSELSMAQETGEVDFVRPNKLVPTSTQGSEPWNRYLMGFRSTHQFGSFCGVSEGYWVVRNLGIYPYLETKQESAYCKSQYSFHLRIKGGLGYFLGTSAGFSLTQETRTEKVKVPNSWQLPSLLLGIVYNFNPKIRANLGLEYYLERFDGIRLRQEANDGEIGSTAQVTDTHLSIDYFFLLKWAAGISYHGRFLELNPPEDLGDSPLAIGASLKKKDRSFALTLTMHLL